MRKYIFGIFAIVFLTLAIATPTVTASPEAAMLNNNKEKQVEVMADDIQDKGKPPYLTYEDAVELALKKSLELQNARQNVIQAEEMRSHLAGMRNMGFTPVGPGYSYEDALDRELLLNFVQADISWQMARKQVEIMEDALAFQVRNAYDEVLKKTGELKIADLALELAAKKMQQAEIKVKCGMESPFNLQTVRDEYNEEQQKRKALEKQLEKAYLDFNMLLGLGQDERAILQGEFVPDWQGDIDLEHHITRLLNENPVLWLQEQKIKLAEYGLDLYTYNVGAPPYKVREIDVIKEKNDLAALKENLETTIHSLYNQLQQLENQYALLETNLVKAQNALNKVTVYYNLGMALAIDRQQAGLALAQLEFQQQNILIAYEQLRLLFEKPWLKSASL
ncbi:MAG: TolC family protein [Dethiobacteria bacterium]|jgi:hypothetical protein